MSRLDLGISFFRDLNMGAKPAERVIYMQKPLLRDTFEFTTRNNLKGKFQQFVIQNGSVDGGLEKYLTKILVNDNIDKDCLKEFITPFLNTSMTVKTKKCLLRLFKDLGLSTPLRELDQWKDLAFIIRNRIDTCSSEDEAIKQIKTIKYCLLQSKSSSEAENMVENFNKIPEILINQGVYRDKNEAENFVKHLTESGIVPTEGLTKALESDAGPVMSMLTMLANSKFRILNVDDHALTQVLNNSSSNIRKIVLQELSQAKERDVFMRQDWFNPSQYVVAVDNNLFVFDKSSETLLARMFGDFSNMEIKNFAQGVTTHSHYDSLNGFVTLKDKDVMEQTGGKSYFRQASVEGQLDVFKIKNGKVDILSRAFSDPDSGELVIKQNLESPLGIKTQSKFLQQNNGDYDYDYTIQSLFNISRTYRTIDENNFVSTFNGQQYNINVSGDLLNITTNGATVTIDLKQLVPSGDKKILDMLKHLPGDELIKIKTSGLKRIDPHLNNSEDASHRDGIIRLGEKYLASPFVFLHEFGHHKASSIDDVVWDRILKIYHKELDVCKAQSTMFDLRMIEHIIDNANHYLNDKHGAVEELFCDVNALLKIPNADRGLAERVLFLQEMFPETITEIAKYI